MNIFHGPEAGLNSGDTGKHGHIPTLKSLSGQGSQTHRELNEIQQDKSIPSSAMSVGWTRREGRLERVPRPKHNRGAIISAQQEESLSQGGDIRTVPRARTTVRLNTCVKKLQNKNTKGEREGEAKEPGGETTVQFW